MSIELPKDVRRVALKSEPLTMADFTKRFDDSNIRVSRPYGQTLVESIQLSGKPIDLELVFPSGRDLGLKQATLFRRFFEAGQAAGLEVLHPEVGLYLRLQDTEQPLGDIYWMAMEPIPDRDGYPSMFGLGRRDSGFWLHTLWVGPADLWYPTHRLAFGYSK